MSFREWISYLLERMLWYLETPRQDRKELKKAKKEPWSSRWFGLLPVVIKLFLAKQRSQIRGGSKNESTTSRRSI